MNTAPNDQPIATTTPTPGIEAARLALAAALDSPGPACGFDAHHAAVTEAFAVLSEVTPPYPPLAAGGLRLTPGEAITRALTHLDAALDEVTSVRDLTRVGITALVLRRIGGVAA